MSRLIRAASAISGLTLLSRVFGLWRDSLMAAVLGAGPVSDTFFLAWALPNLMRRLLGEGALSASFVPAYTAAKKQGDDASRAWPCRARDAPQGRASLDPSGRFGTGATAEGRVP